MTIIRPRSGFINGFTLAELLIALLVLGIIATFTIPKVLQSQQNSSWNSSFKEAMSMASGAWQAYNKDHTATAGTQFLDLTPYMNYVAVDSTSLIDHTYGNNSLDCSSTVICLKLHNGGTLGVPYPTNNDFSGTASTNYIWALFDPDGRYCGNTTCTGKSLEVDVYFNGRVNSGMDRGAADTTDFNGTPTVWPPSTNPGWFSWS